MLTKAVFKILILKTSSNYKSNIAKILQYTFYSNYIPIKKKNNIKERVKIKKYIKLNILKQILLKKIEI